MPCDWIRIVEEMMGGMVYVAGGVFQMGCVSGRDSTCRSDETAHWVQVNSFNIGAYAVTQELWEMVMGDLPASLKNNSTCLGDKKPIVFVSRKDIVDSDKFLERLNARTGKNYRLPTEAEWEYAARGCSGGSCESYMYSGSNTVEDVAWYIDNRPTASAQPVGGKSPNRLGLYDMSGNIYEWCSDWYDKYYGAGSSSALSSTTQETPIINPQGAESGSRRVVHGGSVIASNTASNCRIAYRSHNQITDNAYDIGFRLV
jgi:formylglycine-generating enzyme required for sulfatase activity